MAELKIGDARAVRIEESYEPNFAAGDFFPGSWRPEVVEQHREWMLPHHYDPETGKLKLSIHSWLLRIGGKTILIDTCVGNHKPRPRRPFWDMMSSDRYEEGLAATKLTVDEIDYVMCTHLHVDHVGWNTRLENGRWVPTFPRAKYLFADRELEHWTQRQKDDPASCPWIEDSVLPIVAANRAELVKSDHTLCDAVHLLPTPGHTIDHYAVQIGKLGNDAIITGDMIHSPLQARYPEIGMFSDYDSKQAGETRRALFDRICDTPTVLCTAHFPAPSTGRVTRWGDGFRVVPL
jgi:glyoxylase-like metal-dependent hydrolase (beta-lactamase superfamily II)